MSDEANYIMKQSKSQIQSDFILQGDNLSWPSAESNRSSVVVVVDFPYSTRIKSNRES